MAYRSWLKDVRSIHDLGDHCNNLRHHRPEDEARETGYEEKWRARMSMDIPVAPEFRFAFGSRMHDSWIEWIRREDKTLTIRINNDLAQNYLQTITDVLEIHIPTFLNTKYNQPHPTEVNDWVAPVDLIFDDPVYVNAVRKGPSGELRWSDWKSTGRVIGEWRAPQFLNDWFYTQDGRVQCIVNIWSTLNGSVLSDYLYVLVDCKQARALDHRESTITKTLTPLAGLIWQEMISEDSGYKGWGHEFEFIEGRLAHYGSNWEDLRPSNALSSAKERANS